VAVAVANGPVTSPYDIPLATSVSPPATSPSATASIADLSGQVA
jgi:hypothetical protein